MEFCFGICFSTNAMTYIKKAIEVREIKSMGDLSQDVQGQLFLMG